MLRFGNFVITSQRRPNSSAPNAGSSWRRDAITSPHGEPGIDGCHGGAACHDSPLNGLQRILIPVALLADTPWEKQNANC